MSGIYIHIPFCKQACSYCDFYFITRQKFIPEFVDELIAEIKSKKNSPFTKEPVKTIYIGGGTPSLLTPNQIEKILSAINEVFDVQAEEITLEMNPDDVSRQYLTGLKSAGINRASMGIQSFNPEMLEFMHRAHSAEEAFKSLELLQSTGFNVFTVDLIYGNPSQTLKMLERDIERILQFKPPHISAYSLTIEPQTRLGKQVKLGRIMPPEDDKVARHFDTVIEKLGEAGIHQYEVSNYAKKGFEAVHNANYWNHVNYLGLGPAAHSFWWDESANSAQRWSNKPDFKSYLEGNWQKPFEQEKLSLNKLAEERLMLGLRTTNGISLKQLKEKYHYTFNQAQLQYIKRLQEEGKAIFGDYLRLTTKGLKIADTILLDLVTL